MGAQEKHGSYLEEAMQRIRHALENFHGPVDYINWFAMNKGKRVRRGLAFKVKNVDYSRVAKFIGKGDL